MKIEKSIFGQDDRKAAKEDLSPSDSTQIGDTNTKEISTVGCLGNRLLGVDFCNNQVTKAMSYLIIQW